MYTKSKLEKVCLTQVPCCKKLYTLHLFLVVKKGVHYNSTLQKRIRYNLDAKKRVYITPDPCFRARLQSVV